VPGSPCFVGLDLGTSAMKGAVVDMSGAVLAEAQVGYPTFRPAPHSAEQDPSDWLRATRQVVAELADQVAPQRWGAIGLSGMIPTLVTLDARGRPAGPAVTWEDARAEGEAAELRSVLGGEALYRSTGQWLDGRYLLAMFLRLANDDPARGRAVATLCSAKDYLFGELTGVILTDPSTAAGFGCYGIEAGSWIPEVLEAAAGLAAVAMPDLPPVRSSISCLPLAGVWSESSGLPSQLPVVLGAADSVLGAEGLGVRRHGEVAYVAGTSNVICALSDELCFDEAHRFLVTPTARAGQWALEMDLLTTGSALAWLARMLLGSAPVAASVALAHEVEPEDAPVFLPYLGGGEQGALWDPTLQGALLGLRLHHERGHLVRALMNGIVMESRRCLAVLDEAALPRSGVHVAGTSASWPTFGHELADATRRAVVMPSQSEASHSALGAALLASRALHGDDGAVPRPSPPGERLEPDRERSEVWDWLFSRHEAALRGLRAYLAGQVGR
jgi:xylulokinase